MSGAQTIAVTVTDVVTVNDLVKLFEFKRTDGGQLPAFSGGAHTVVEMRDGDVTRRNPYSLMSDPCDTSAYTISVRRDDQGRGGSLFLHEQVKIGDPMVISYPVNLFSLDLRARKHLMIAGGIGITPFLAQIKQLTAINGHFELHYSVRTAALGSYADDLRGQFPNHVHIYHDDQKQTIDLAQLLARQPLGTHVYVCGPKGMIKWVCSSAEAQGWPKSAIHSEEFLAPQSGAPFDVTLARSGQTLHVSENQSLLEALEAAGTNPPYLCRGGACGQCETDVIRHEGSFVHRDHWLSEEDHQSCSKIMPCVSRFIGKTLVIDR
jgi:dimethylamine monooxygenase subunit B